MSGLDSPGAYPGNPSLPREVRDKILSTFRHTLNLFKEGKLDDCLIGCDFILKMDPRFAPARQLLDKTKNPAAAVDVGALETIVAETLTRQDRVVSVETDRMLVRAAESFNARDFDAAIAGAEHVLQALPGNQDAAQILAKARQKKAAQPQFEVARQRAIAALDGNRLGEARSALDRMRSLDAEHPAVTLLDRRLAPTDDVSEIGESTNPGLVDPRAAEAAGAGGDLDNLSLDSLSLDEPLESHAFVPPPADAVGPGSGPLLFSERAASDMDFSPAEPGIPPDLWSEPAEEIGGPSLDAGPSPARTPTHSASRAPAPPTPDLEPPSQQQEIQSLLQRGDEASQAGNRQQAIEIWSRIFLIDINNSEAVGRIERARKEMADGNRKIVEGLKHGRESFEGGDFTGAREAFLQVLAVDENDATARSYLDRIEQELTRPSAGLDLSKKTPAGDILDEEMAEAVEPEEPAEAEPIEKSAAAAKPARRTIDKRFLMALGGALLLGLVVGGYFLLRPSRGKGGAVATEGGPSLEHATMLFREGKLTETVAELRQIAPEHPDYARAQKLLASLTRKTETAETAPGAPGGPAEKAAPRSGPDSRAAHLREAAEKAFSEKRYIDALKSFNLAAPSFQGDPSFAQSIGAASEKVNELTPAVKLYNEGEYETAIPILWRIFQADRANQDARSYLLRSYYNQGIAQLQNGLYPKAAESFKEVVAIDPQDTDAIRHKKFAERYLKGDLDLMGRIYVRHVQQRP